jgi:hypothetical protein
MSLRALSRLAASAAFLVPVLGLLVAGCSSSSTSGGGGSCNPGAQQSCSCSGGASGVATCDNAGVYGECACASGGDASTVDTGTSGEDSGTTGDDSSAAEGGDHCSGCGDGGGLGDATPLDAAPGTFGSMCAANSDCNSMDCSDFPAKGGGFCTVPCTTPADCPPQAQGCNGMGQCKVP